jgi:hypothetical protein
VKVFTKLTFAVMLLASGCQCSYVFPSAATRHGPRATFSSTEDEQLKQIMALGGWKSWNAIAAQMPGRTGRQCRERWNNYVNPSLNMKLFTPDEDRLLMQKHKELGTKWEQIVHFFPGRSKNFIKNRWGVLQRHGIVQETDLSPVPPPNSPLEAFLSRLGDWKDFF